MDRLVYISSGLEHSGLANESPQRDNSRMGKINHAADDFPQGFRQQRISVSEAAAVADLPPAEIAAYFRKNPKAARDLLIESCDKRYSPSSFIAEESHGFSVGWYSTSSGYQCVRRFSTLADAATDYLLFSLGKGRWRPIEANTSN